MNNAPWSCEEDLWMLANREKYNTYAELAAALNDACGGRRTGCAVKVRLGHKYGVGMGRTTRYSDAERRYIERNYRDMTLRELADGLRAISGRAVTTGAIWHYLKDTLGAKRTDRTGRIRKGETIGYVAPIGAEYLNADGYTLVKVSDTGIKNRDWKTKQAVMWKRYHGMEPDGVVIFLDGNRVNFDRENLYCVSHRIHAVMCSNGWYTHSREHTLTAIKWCELFYALKGCDAPCARSVE